jgi:antitoxin YefM
MSISASEARQRLFPLLEQVNTDHEPVRITSKAGDAVLMSADDYDSWQETVYLLRSPENARRLMEAVARDKATRTVGSADPATSIEELEEMAGGQA